MIVEDLLRSSLRLIGQLGPGRTPSASETTDALFVCNQMLEAWSTERLNVFTVGRDLWPLTAGKGDYTIGVQGIYIDLVIHASAANSISSARNPFTQEHVGRQLVITGGAGFTPQTVTITAVSNGHATLSAPPGAPGATAGEGAIGAGDFAAYAPTYIERAGLLRETVEYPCEIYRGAERWSTVSMKSLEGYTWVLYPDGDYPLMGLHLYPVPDSACTLVLYSRTPLAGVSSASQTLDMPAGYADAIRYNWADRLALEWGKPIRPEVRQYARESLARIRAINAPVHEMHCDPAVGSASGWNIYSGDYA